VQTVKGSDCVYKIRDEPSLQYGQPREAQSSLVCVYVCVFKVRSGLNLELKPGCMKPQNVNLPSVSSSFVCHLSLTQSET